MVKCMLAAQRKLSTARRADQVPEDVKIESDGVQILIVNKRSSTWNGLRDEVHRISRLGQYTGYTCTQILEYLRDWAADVGKRTTDSMGSVGGMDSGGMGGSSSGMSSTGGTGVSQQLVERMIAAGASMALQHYQQQMQPQMQPQMQQQQLALTNDAENSWLREAAVDKYLKDADEDEVRELAARKLADDGDDELKELAAQKINEDDEVKELAAQKLIDDDNDEVKELAAQKLMDDMNFDALKIAFRRAKRARTAEA